MSWKPWQVLAALAWGALGLVLVVLFMLELVPVGVVWIFTIAGGTVGAVIAVLDRRARQRILNLELD